MTMIPGGYPPPNYQTTVPTSGLATASMICGIASLLLCGLTGIPAIICGHMAMSETRSGRRGGHGMAVTGLIFGYLTTIGWVLFWSLALFGSLLGTAGVSS